MSASSPWKLLIVDDEPAMAWFLADIAESEGYAIEIAESGDEGVAKIEQGGYHAVLTDYRMPGRNGLDLIRFTRKHDPELPLVMITGYATVENTIEAFHLGVFDLLEKPFDLAVGRALLQRLRETLEQKQQLSNRISLLDLQQEPLPVLVAESEAMQQSRRIAQAFAQHSDPMLVYGEEGTGRTLLARWIHRWSESDGSLLKLDAESLQLDEMEQLLSALGTESVLLLQRVESLPESALRRIMWLLKERGIRLLATATEQMQQPLPLHLYHLFPGMVPTPQLLQRQPDLLPIMQQWMEAAAQQWQIAQQPLSSQWIEQFVAQQRWPGNLGQLRQQFLQWLMVQKGTASEQQPLFYHGEGDSPRLPLSETATLAEVERFWIEQTLGRLQGNRTRAAESLGINPSTLFRKLKGSGV